LVLEVSTNLPDKYDHSIRFPRGQGVAGWVAANGQPVVTDDLTQDPRFFSGVQDRTGFVTRSYLCVPLKVRERIIGTAQVLNRHGPISFTEEDLHIMEGFARQAAIAIENSRLHAEELEKKRIEEELEQAHRIQNNLLPHKDPQVEDYDISGLSFPCRWVGGDYYDFIQIGEKRLGVAVADVCGKGIPAAVMMSTIQAVLRSLTDQNLHLEQIVPNLNRYLCHNSTNDKFVTFFYGELDSQKHTFQYINCGHNPPYVINGKGEVKPLLEGGMILGVLEDTEFPTGKINLDKGDLIVLYTDGVTEIRNSNGIMFGERRLIKDMKAVYQEAAKEIVRTTHQQGVAFAGERGLEDDFTLLCIKRLG
jgi:sigma-B regulation protein RsbU (phosphoserine phosphatase)